MDLLLEWIYGGLEATPSLSEAKLLFEAANKFDLPELQFRCEQLMAEHLDLQSYPELHELARCFNASVLEQVNISPAA